VFELLKQLSTVLLQGTREQPAVQAFGIALILLVWINYFSRVVVLAAAWAHTSPEARAVRDARRVADQLPEGPRIDLAAAAGVRSADPAPAASPKAAFAAGAASMLGLVALVRRRRE
jgi:membrane protein